MGWKKARDIYNKMVEHGLFKIFVLKFIHVTMFWDFLVQLKKKKRRFLELPTHFILDDINTD